MAKFFKVNYDDGTEIFVNLNQVTHFNPEGRVIHIANTRNLDIPSVGMNFKSYLDSYSIYIDEQSAKKLLVYMNKNQVQ